MFYTSDFHHYNLFMFRDHGELFCGVSLGSLKDYLVFREVEPLLAVTESEAVKRCIFPIIAGTIKISVHDLVSNLDS